MKIMHVLALVGVSTVCIFCLVLVNFYMHGIQDSVVNSEGLHISYTRSGTTLILNASSEPKTSIIVDYSYKIDGNIIYFSTFSTSRFLRDETDADIMIEGIMPGNYILYYKNPDGTTVRMKEIQIK